MKTQTNWHREGEIKYLVVWTAYDGNPEERSDVTTDTYEAYESLAEAQARYEFLLDEGGVCFEVNTHSVHICAVVESSDYPQHPALAEEVAL